MPRPKQFWGLSDIEPLREPLGELNRALTQLSRILELSEEHPGLFGLG